MKNDKVKNAKEIAYLRKINKERKRINEKLDNELTELVKKGESLADYELWINEKCDIFINPVYAIKKVIKNLEKEGYSKNIVYVLLKIEEKE